MTSNLKPDPCLHLAAGRPPLHPGRPKGERQRLLLMALVDSNPGIHILRAAHLMGLNWNTCHHHVRRLVSEGRVVVRKVHGRLCLFDRREGAVAPRLAPLLLRDGRTASLVRLILDRPGANQKTLAGELGIAPSAVHRHLLRLERAGLVQRVHQAREVATFATDVLAAACSGAGAVPLVPAMPPAEPEPVATLLPPPAPKGFSPEVVPTA